MTTRYDSKDPGETITMGFDFSEAGTPSNPEVSITVRRGEDADPAAMLVGSPVVSGNLVLQKAMGGVDGVDYAVRCLADVDGDRLLIDSILPVRSRPTP